MSAARKSRFFWASVAGADPEPVEVTEIDGRQVAYTCGCADPFYLDDSACPVVLGRMGSSVSAGKEWRYFTPESPKQLERYPLVKSLENERQEAERRYVKGAHRWRGPR